MIGTKWHVPLWGAALLLGAGLAIQTAPTSGADVCGDVGGRHVSVGGCTDPGAYVAPPEDAPPPEEAPPPPPPPDVDMCASVGRRVSVSGCV